eukprot:9587936-Alexandrium_andersonii.AAC.1
MGAQRLHSFATYITRNGWFAHQTCDRICKMLNRQPREHKQAPSNCKNQRQPCQANTASSKSKAQPEARFKSRCMGC